MVELLTKHSNMRVLEAKNGMELEGKTIIICPPNKNIFIEDEQIILRQPNEKTIMPKPSVDLFFTSLATAKERKAIGIILSGTGSDGSLGMQAIKSCGGITIAQNPKSAKYDGMPLASINGNNVDIIVDPEEMGDEILDIIEYIDGKGELQPSQPPQNELDAILFELKTHCGVDFSEYKLTTVHRRIQRRMAAKHMTSISEYVEYLRQEPNESKLLFKDMLIGVTSFNRDPESYNELRIHLLARLKSLPDTQANIRFWIVGCSSGEEAYSLAILLSEVLKETGLHKNIQIFATDLDGDSIRTARHGIYPASSLSEMDEGIIKHYFTIKDDSYQVIKTIRDMVIFSEHDVTRDPPFNNLDIVVCRNLLIYFNQNLQQRVMHSFLYALRSGGLLFLGRSEHIGSYEEYFTPLSKEHRVYRKAYAPDVKPDALRAYRLPNSKKTAQKESFQTRERSLQEALLESIGEYFLPLSAVVNEAMNIVYLKESIPYLTPPPGLINTNILKMVHPSLELELRGAMHKSMKQNEPTVTTFTKVTLFDNYEKVVRICVIPMNIKKESSKLYVVSFQQEDPDVFIDQIPLRESTHDAQTMQLEYELKKTKAQLQAVIEELETSNEELQSTNEELQSANEELQSTNEELETTNEELQSTNEEIQVAYNELKTVSEEREQQRRIAESTSIELEEERVLLRGVLDSSQSGIMAFQSVRDSSYKIIDFEFTLINKQAQKIVGKDSSELLGKRLLVEMPGNKEEGLFDIYVDVTEHRKNIEREFHYTHEGLNNRFYQVIVPYKDGFVVTFTDVTKNREIQEKLRLHEERLRLATSAGRIGTWDWDLESGELSWDEMMYRLYGVTEKPQNTYKFWRSFVHPDDLPFVEEAIKKSLDGKSLFDVEFRIVLNNGEIRYISAMATTVKDMDGKPLRMVGINIDITKDKKAQQSLRQSHDFVESLIETANALVVGLDEEGNIELFNKAAEELSGYSRDEVVGKNWFDTISPKERFPEVYNYFTSIVIDDKHTNNQHENPIITKEGREEILSWRNSVCITPKGKKLLLSFGIPITERVKIEDELRSSEKYIHSILDAQNNIVAINDGNELIEVNATFFEIFTEWHTLEEFKKEHKCICELFEKSDEAGFLYDGKDGREWIDVLKEDPSILHQVKIKRGGRNYVFVLRYQSFAHQDKNRNILVLTDVSSLDSYRRELESRIDMEIKNRRQKEELLIQQSKLAAMGEMIGAIAHQWRQPLNVVSMYISFFEDVYEEKNPTKEELEYFETQVNTVREQIEYMSQTINDFRNFFKTDQEKKSFICIDALKKCLELIKAQLKHNSITVDIRERADSRCRIYGVQNQFQQSILNILLNAKDAIISAREKGILEKATEGKIDIDIGCENLWTTIDIKDNGGGIRLDDISKIFEPYFTTKHPSVGTGIGLYMTKTIIERQMGGFISVKNVENGALFSIRVPNE